MFVMYLLLTWVLLISKLSCTSTEKLPVIIWHGMGDRGTGMGILKLAKAIQDEIPGTYVKCITTSNSVIQDIEDTYFMPINDQLDYVCRMIHEDKNLSNGLHMIGISQGGLFVRALVQKCNLSKVGTVVSIGGPQQGIFGIPKCTIDGFIHLCLLMNELLSYGAYIKFIQSHVVQAQYWHDPLEEDVYRKYSQFLADINQENEINEIYREKMRNIQRLVLVKFSGDTIVIPKESEWFGFYQNGSSTNITALQDSILYTEDRLGLRELNKRVHSAKNIFPENSRLHPDSEVYKLCDHGNSFGMDLMSQLVKRAIPGIYVKTISTNIFNIEDVRDTVFLSINDQLDYVCRMLHKDKKLSNGFHMIGISQGGLLVRALVQKCNFSKVGTVVSIGGLQQGIFGIPRCINTGFVPYCLWLNKFLSDIVYTEYIQNRFVPAQYWHDPFKENVYRKYSRFLADINQENRINETYRENMKKIQRLVLVKFTNDTTVLPSESSWFGFYRRGSSTDIIKLRDSILYNEDRLGLKVLDKRGDLHLIEKTGEHLDFTNQWFIDNILIRYMK